MRQLKAIIAILVFSAFLVWAVWNLVPEPRKYEPPIKHTQSWTITDPDGRTWKAVKND